MITNRRAYSDPSRPAALCKPPQGAGDESSEGFSVTVVFTTVPDTLFALRKAAELAEQLGARIQILAPFVVPYPLPIDRPSVDPSFRMRRFRTLCEEESIETRIEIRLCRDFCECLMQGLRPQSVVLIGGRERGGPLLGKRG